MRPFFLVLLFSAVLRAANDEVPIAGSCPSGATCGFDFYSEQDVGFTIPEKGKLGRNEIKILLSKPKLPSGYIVSSYLDVLSEPENVRSVYVLDGYPKTTVELFGPGKYDFSIRVNLVYRSSCGGIQVASLAKQTFSFDVTE